MPPSMLLTIEVVLRESQKGRRLSWLLRPLAILYRSY
jgi:hypothetical protein